jgi:hypothetical protein
LQSNQFDTTWTNASTTETSGQPDKDGGSDAWKLTKHGNAGYIQQSVSTSGVITQSIYAKAGTLNWIRISNSGFSNGTTYYDLANGVLGTSLSDVVDASIQDLGNGWYRLTQVLNGSGGGLRIFPATADGDVTGTTGYLYIQNAQLESGLVATDYLDSGATTAKAGVLVDLPRVNYDANGENGSLLLEPQRTNLIQYSEYFGGWSKVISGTGVNPVVTDNYAISPEGLKNAARVQLDIGSGTTDSDFSQIQLNVTTVVGTTYTGSIYLKSNTGVNQDIVFQINGQGIIATTITPEWTRYKVTAAATSTGGFFRIRIRGNEGTNKNADFLVYGAQLESSAPYVSSYIPNHGTSAGVTRAADSCSVTGVSDVIGQTEGTLFVDFEYLDGQSGANENWFALESDAGGERVLFYKGSSTNQRILIQANASTVYANSSLFALSAGTRYKLAVRYNSGDIAVYLNGSQLVTDTSTYTRTDNLNNVTFNESNQALSSRFNQMFISSEGLSNAELATLTTL